MYHNPRISSASNNFEEEIQVELLETIPKPPNISPFLLIIGIITDSDKQVIPLLQDILLLREQKYIERIDTILLENCSDTVDDSQIKHYLGQISNNSIIITKRQQILDSEKGLFGSSFVRDNSRLPISKARTMLQKYLGLIAINNPESIVWILDDDMRLHDKVFNYLPWLPTMKSTGIDILLGRFDGGSPNPPMNAVRVQTLDLLCNLERLENHEDNEVLPDLEHKNRELRKKYPDYYYDLSRKHTGHLESPYWVNKIDNMETVGELRERINQNIFKIFSGEPFFRPLIVDLPGDPIKETVKSANRGGNTFIFNPETLLKTPNPSLIICGIESRRSDMMWALINMYHFKYKVKLINFPVLHNRTVNTKLNLDLEKTIQEIQGASIYAGLSEFLERNDITDLQFSDNQINEIWELASAYLERRIAQYKLNFESIKNLNIALKNFEKYRQVKEYRLKIDEIFSDDGLRNLIDGSRKLNYDELKKALISMSNQINDYFNATSSETMIVKMGDT